MERLSAAAWSDSAAWPRSVGHAATNVNGRERKGILQATGDGAASIAAFDTRSLHLVRRARAAGDEVRTLDDSDFWKKKLVRRLR